MLIDVVGWFLAFVAVTGLCLLVYLKKIRARALITMAAGAAMVILIAKFL